MHILLQVHRAKLVTGEEVVLKVQKPGVESVLKADLGFIYIASKVIELLQPELARTSFSAVSCVQYSSN
jgi:aarF domain-containing kinase